MGANPRCADLTDAWAKGLELRDADARRAKGLPPRCRA